MKLFCVNLFIRTKFVIFGSLTGHLHFRIFVIVNVHVLVRNLNFLDIPK